MHLTYHYREYNLDIPVIIEHNYVLLDGLGQNQHGVRRGVEGFHHRRNNMPSIRLKTGLLKGKVGRSIEQLFWDNVLSDQ